MPQKPQYPQLTNFINNTPATLACQDKEQKISVTQGEI